MEKKKFLIEIELKTLEFYKSFADNADQPEIMLSKMLELLRIILIERGIENYNR